VSLRGRFFLYVFVAFSAIVVFYLLVATLYITHRTEKKAKELYEEVGRALVHTKRLAPGASQEELLSHVKEEKDIDLVVVYEGGKLKVLGEGDPTLLPSVLKTEGLKITGSPLKPVFVFRYDLGGGKEVFFVKRVNYDLVFILGYLFLLALIPLLNLVVSARFLREVIEEIAFLKRLSRQFSEGRFERIEELRKSIESSKRKDELYELKVAILKMVENLTGLIEKTKREKSLYETMALTDPLTGLYNRRMFMELAKKELSRAQRYGEPLSLVLLDIDHFKKINDTYGHDAGDLAIRHVAEILRKNLRSADVVARWGGEEFVILLPKTELEEAVKVAEKLRRLVEGDLLKLPDGKTVRLTFSAGVSTFREGESLDQLLKEADEALYEAKRKGRNRVEVFKAFSSL